MDAQYIHKPGAQVHPRRVGRRVHLLLRHLDPSRPSLRVSGQARRLRQDAARPRRVARRRRAPADPRRRRAFAADGVTVRATGPDGKSYQVRARRVRRRHRPRRADRRPPPAQGRRRRRSPPTSRVHTMYKDVDRSHGADEGNIILGLFDGGWWWMIPFKDGDTSVGMVFEKSYTKANAALSPQQLYRGGARAPAAPQALLAGRHPLPRRRRAGQLVAIARRCSTASGCSWSATRRRSSIRCSRRACCSRSTAPSSRPSTSTPRSATATSPPSASRPTRTQCIRRHGHLQEPRARVLLARTCARSCSLRRRIRPSAPSITSMLAGDVYKPSMWHSVVKKGFSQEVLR